MTLPPAALRMGGDHFLDDDDFLGTAVSDVHRLQQHAGLTADSRLLDWGCGAGRLAVGIRAALGHVHDYHGVDVQTALIAWATENLGGEHFRFSLVTDVNARYNPSGGPQRRIPADPSSVDVLYAYSVLSHMLVDDVAQYARIIAKILTPEGRAMVTAFVEDETNAWQENPSGYGPFEWSGRLHSVRYDRAYFENLLRRCGLYVELYEHGHETDGQSLYVLRRAR